MIKLKDILKEIGDASVPGYSWTLKPGSGFGGYFYQFETDSGLTYEVTFAGSYGTYDVSFYTIDKDGDEMSTSEETNMGEQYGIMSTMVDIIQDFRNNQSPEPVEQLDIVPDKSGTDSDGFNYNRRYKMYAAYIEKLRWMLGIKDVDYDSEIITIEFELDYPSNHPYDSTGIKDKK